MHGRRSSVSGADGSLPRQAPLKAVRDRLFVCKSGGTAC